MEIHYTVEFFSYWHCGSGLSAGADVDALVVKDKDGLPYIPGKTVKGLIREAVEEVAHYRKSEIDTSRIFGFCDDADNRRQGEAFFSNAELPENDRNKILKGELSEYLFTSLSNTSIGEDGIAKDHSLRKTEVTLPCILEGKILNVPEDCAKIITDSFGYIKRLGVDRNRGLGRCCFSVK